VPGSGRGNALIDVLGIGDGPDAEAFVLARRHQASGTDWSHASWLGEGA
jgi:hypothetical protein